MIDFFIIDKRIAHAVARIITAVDLASSPHSAVLVRLRRSATSELLRMLRRPSRFPASRPIGCAREPSRPDSAFMASLANLVSQLDLDSVSAGFEHFVSLAEGELCGLCDKVGPDGMPDPKFIGRGKELDMVWRHATLPTARENGRADPVTLALQWLGIRLSELRALVHVKQNGVSDGRSLSALGTTHWHAILTCIRAPQKNLAALLRSAEGAEWQQRVGTLALTEPGAVLNVDTLWTWASEARAAARGRARAASAGALRCWRAFVDQQLKCGAGALHRFTKRPPIAACASIIREGRRTLAPQHLVDADCES